MVQVCHCKGQLNKMFPNFGSCTSLTFCSCLVSQIPHLTFQDNIFFPKVLRHHSDFSNELGFFSTNITHTCSHTHTLSASEKHCWEKHKTLSTTEVSPGAGDVPTPFLSGGKAKESAGGRKWHSPNLQTGTLWAVWVPSWSVWRPTCFPLTLTLWTSCSNSFPIRVGLCPKTTIVNVSADMHLWQELKFQFHSTVMISLAYIKDFQFSQFSCMVNTVMAWHDNKTKIWTICSFVFFFSGVSLSLSWLFCH